MRTLLTLFVLLHCWWGAGDLHGQTVGPTERMAVPYDKSPGLPVLQQIDGLKEKEVIKEKIGGTLD